MKPYNKIPLSITNGLNRQAIGTAGGYIQLLDSSAGANVQIHLNEQNADGIPLKDYHAIEADGVDKIFVSADAVDGGTITILQSTKKQFKLITPASDINIDEIGSYSDVAISQLKTSLDKIINPYEKDFSNFIHANSNSPSVTTFFSKTFTKDTKVSLTFGYKMGYVSSGYGYIVIKIDGVQFDMESFGNYSGTNNRTITFENMNGKTITAEGKVSNTNFIIFISMLEYDLKI